MYDNDYTDLWGVVRGHYLFASLRRAAPVAFLSCLICGPYAHAAKVGAFKWDETITASLEYNSNITTAEEDPIDDIIFQARFAVDGSWES